MIYTITWRRSIVADDALDRAVSAVAGCDAPYWGFQPTRCAALALQDRWHFGASTDLSMPSRAAGGLTLAVGPLGPAPAILCEIEHYSGLSYAKRYGSIIISSIPFEHYELHGANRAFRRR
jgi:hypothetical protein